MDEPTRNPPATSLPMLRPRIDIPVVVKTAAQLSQRLLYGRGQHCARQDRWADFALMLDTSDQARRHLPCGQTETDALLEGALSDILSHATACILQNATDKAVAISADMQVGFGSAAHYPALRLVHAQAQLRIAQMIETHMEQRPTAHACSEFHSARDQLVESALETADDMDPVLYNSPAIAQLHCDVIPWRPDSRGAALSAYQDLIDLDPTHFCAMASLGRDLLPDRFGNLDDLDTAAHHLGDHLSDIWGQGGYVWTYLDAILADPHAARQLDTPLFIQGLEDILGTAPDQHVMNRLVAGLGVSATAYGPETGLGDDIRACLRNLVSSHLHEIHPAIWANAMACSDPKRTTGFSDTAGESRAKSVLAHIFADDIADGKRILFTADHVIIRREM